MSALRQYKLICFIRHKASIFTHHKHMDNNFINPLMQNRFIHLIKTRRITKCCISYLYTIDIYDIGINYRPQIQLYNPISLKIFLLQSEFFLQRNTSYVFFQIAGKKARDINHIMIPDFLLKRSFGHIPPTLLALRFKGNCILNPFFIPASFQLFLIIALSTNSFLAYPRFNRCSAYRSLQKSDRDILFFVNLCSRVIAGRTERQQILSACAYPFSLCQ